MKVRELIQESLEDIGVAALEQTVDAATMKVGLARFNRILKSLVPGVNLFKRVVDTHVLTPSDLDYTIGSGGNINVLRPTIIESATIKDSGGYEHHVDVRPIAEYWRLAVKTTLGRPYRLYYNPDYPLGIIYLYYTPESAETLIIVSQKPLVQVVLDDDMVNPPEYDAALVGLLSLSLCIPFGKTLSAEHRAEIKAAISSMRGINIANALHEVSLDLPGARGGRYNINEG